MKPLSDRIIIEPLPQSETTVGGLLVPPEVKARTTRGRIVAVGPGRTTIKGKRVPMSSKVGDIVLYGDYAALEIIKDGVRYHIIRESDAWCFKTGENK